MESGAAKLWLVSSGNGELGPPVPLTGGFPDCQAAPYDVITVGGRLAIHGQFGLTSDGRCAVPGGFMIADPATGAVTERFASNRGFRQLVAGADGRYAYLTAGRLPGELKRAAGSDSDDETCGFLAPGMLRYGLDVGAPDWRQVSIANIDAASGQSRQREEPGS